MVAKKTAAKKPVKTTRKKVSKKTSSKKAAQMQSFRVYKDAQPFTQARLSRQTAYWSVLLIFIIITQLWILKIQMDIAEVTLLIAN